MHEIRVSEGPGATLPAVPKNLVIVESPAKARTIERYLGVDYRVLASYGHVRDLPENPGKGKFGVDVDHEFAPEYVISEDRRKQVNEIEKAAKGSDMVYLATDLDREGEAIAWHVAEAAHVPDGEDPPGDLQRDHRTGDPGSLRAPPGDRSKPRRRPADAPDRGPPGRLHPEPAARQARSSVASRPAGSSPWPSASSLSASARSLRSRPGSTGPSGRPLRQPPAKPSTRTWSGSMAWRRRSRTRAPRMPTSRRSGPFGRS
ncbi:MAG: toprim domain-containing protein [Candidatus Limnocylindrales bacterium]